jgi:hypothetical protein
MNNAMVKKTVTSVGAAPIKKNNLVVANNPAANSKNVSQPVQKPPGNGSMFYHHNLQQQND